MVTTHKLSHHIDLWRTSDGIYLLHVQEQSTLEAAFICVYFDDPEGKLEAIGFKFDISQIWK